MTEQEAAKLLQKEKELSSEVKTKGGKIDDFFVHSDKVLEEGNVLITGCMKYLNTPDDGGKNAPIPAFKGANPNPHETNRAVELLNELMAEAKSFLIEEIAFRKKYDTCAMEIGTYLKKTDNLYKLLGNVKPDAPDRLRKEASRKAYTEIKKMPSYIVQIDAIILQMDAMLNTISTYEPRLKSMKNKINILKQVN
ncbi:MAG TPA: hypothetical protein VF411_11550 [Bacteroidia bacterium]